MSSAACTYTTKDGTKSSDWNFPVGNYRRLTVTAALMGAVNNLVIEDPVDSPINIARDSRLRQPDRPHRPNYPAILLEGQVILRLTTPKRSPSD